MKLLATSKAPTCRAINHTVKKPVRGEGSGGGMVWETRGMRAGAGGGRQAVRRGSERERGLR